MTDFSTYSPLALALLGTGFTFLCTTFGAAIVFFFKNDIKDNFLKIFLGFAAGIMIAAAVFSLLIPAIEMTAGEGKIGWLPVVGGFLLGAIFLYLLDIILPHLHIGSDKPEGLPSKMKRPTMLILAITLHNIPEGLAFGVVSCECGLTSAMAAVFTLSLGIGLQNIPEGATISLMFKSVGFSRKKAFLYGTLSGFVEPIAAVLGVLLVAQIAGIMPWLLAFAGGAMLYVVVEELIPATQSGEHSHTGTISIMAGFLVMMILEMVFSN